MELDEVAKVLGNTSAYAGSISNARSGWTIRQRRAGRLALSYKEGKSALLAILSPYALSPKAIEKQRR